MIQFIGALISGLNLGSIYALIALGYTMVYGIAKMLNFAHGDIIMVGAYSVIVSAVTLKLPPVVAILIAVVVCAALGVTIEFLAYRPLRQSPPLAVLITAIGVSYLLQNLALLIFGPEQKSTPALFDLPSLTLGGVTVDGITLLTLGVTAAIMVGLTLFINLTRMGKAMRAVSEDRDAAELMGISVNKTITITFAIGSALAAVASVFFGATYTYIKPTTGSMPGIKAFTAAVFGGIGSIPGAMLGGILLGLIEQLSKVYISTLWSDAVVFVQAGGTARKARKGEGVSMGKKNILRSGFFNADRVTLLAVTAVFAVMAVLVYTGNVGRQIQNMLTSVACYIVLAVSLNLVVGLLGELSLGHAGFMSVGLFTGCTVAVLLQGKLPAAVCLPLCMVIGGLAAALVGLVVGLPALRLGGDYLAIVTLGCGEIIKNVLTNLNIKGTPLQGALGIDTSSIRRNSKDLLPYAILLVLLTMLVIMNFKRSKHGRAIMAIRDNRIAAEATGVNVVYYKLMVFMLAAFFAGAAGVLYGYSLPVVQADTFGYNMSIEILVIVVLGGMGNIGGSILAAIVLRALPEALRDFSDYRMLAYSVLLIAIMLLNENKRFKAWKSRFSLSGWFRGLRRGKAGGKEADAS